MALNHTKGPIQAQTQSSFNDTLFYLSYLLSGSGGSASAGTTATASGGTLARLVVTLTANATSTTLFTLGTLTTGAERTALRGLTSGNTLASLQSGRDDGLGQVEGGTQELNASVGQVVIVVAPVVRVLDVGTGLERLHSLDDMQVLHANGRVGMETLLAGNQDSLLEEVGIDLVSLLLGNQHFESTAPTTRHIQTNTPVSHSLS